MSWPEKPKLKHTARLFCKPASKAYQDGWDAVFGKKGKIPPSDTCERCGCYIARGSVACTPCLVASGIDPIAFRRSQKSGR